MLLTGKMPVRLFTRDPGSPTGFQLSMEKEVNAEYYKDVFVLRHDLKRGVDILFMRVNGVSLTGATIDFYELTNQNVLDISTAFPEIID